jgi:hypothetical protein
MRTTFAPLPGRNGHATPRPARTALAIAALAAALFAGGCTHVGPKSVTVDRFDYATAIGESWKQQTLLNIVKLRYLDLPVFLDVASIVAGYSMETSGSLGGQLSTSSAIQGDSLTLGASGRFTDRPTITYVPLTGEKFLRGLVTPIHPRHIFSMLQSGYAADFVLGLTVDALNGVRNRAATGTGVREADPDFVRALELMRDVQTAGAIGMRVDEDTVKGQTAVLFFRRDDVDPGVRDKGAEIRRILGLPVDQERFVLTYSPVRGGEGELAVSSRSMLQVMAAFGSYLDVPEAHARDGSVVATHAGPASKDRKGGIRIHSGETKPADAFAAARYREHWYWIENGDLLAKRALTAVMFFFTLADTGESGRLPLITIPAQ